AHGYDLVVAIAVVVVNVVVMVVVLFAGRARLSVVGGRNLFRDHLGIDRFGDDARRFFAGLFAVGFVRLLGRVGFVCVGAFGGSLVFLVGAATVATATAATAPVAATAFLVFLVVVL